MSRTHCGKTAGSEVVLVLSDIKKMLQAGLATRRSVDAPERPITIDKLKMQSQHAISSRTPAAHGGEY